MRHDRTLARAWCTIEPIDRWADRRVRLWRAIDRALPWAFRASILLALATAVWGAFGGPLP
jgi:hypothetical protein